MTTLNLRSYLKRLFVFASVSAVAACMGSSNTGDSETGTQSTTTTVPDIIIDVPPVATPSQPDDTGQRPLDESDSLTVVADVVTVDVTGGTYVPDVFIPTAVQQGDIDQIIFDDSGIILLPKSALSDALNEPGAIRQLLLDGSGIDFPQAANWTFRVLDNSDTISELLWVRFRFYLPPWSSYANIVVGDEGAFIEQFIERYFDDLEPGSNTGDIMSDILTTSSSMTTVSTSGATY